MAGVPAARTNGDVRIGACPPLAQNHPLPLPTWSQSWKGWGTL